MKLWTLVTMNWKLLWVSTKFEFEEIFFSLITSTDLYLHQNSELPKNRRKSKETIFINDNYHEKLFLLLLLLLFDEFSLPLLQISRESWDWQIFVWDRKLKTWQFENSANETLNFFTLISFFLKTKRKCSMAKRKTQRKVKREWKFFAFSSLSSVTADDCNRKIVCSQVTKFKLLSFWRRKKNIKYLTTLSATLFYGMKLFALRNKIAAIIFPFSWLSNSSVVTKS